MSTSSMTPQEAASSPTPSRPSSEVSVPAPATAGPAEHKRRWWWTLVACFTSFVIASAATMLVSDYWLGNFRIPLDYGGDVLLYLPLVKGMQENGTYWVNPRMGAPGGFLLYDFPDPDTFHFATLWLLATLTGDPSAAFNLFVLLQFPLAAVSATWVTRRFGAGVMPAVLAGVLFAYLPHHTVMYSNHIFLCAYYPVPLAFWVVIRVYLGELRLLRRDAVTNKLRLPFLSADGFVALAVCALVASTGAYYAFFAAGLLGVAAVGNAIGQWKWTALIPGVLLAAVIMLGLIANLAPALAYQKSHGPNPTVQRSDLEGHVWALRPAELFLPSQFHREDHLGAVSQKYVTDFAPLKLPDLACICTVGLVPGLGLVLSLALGLRRTAPPDDAVRPILSKLLVVMLLVSVVGGFGPLFNHFVTPWIRCYHRIVVFIGFVGVFHLALSVTRLACAPRRWVRVLATAATALLVGVGVYDQTFPKLIRGHEKRGYDFRSDREYVQAVEAALPDGAAVFQLPYVQYPEPGFVGEIDNYTPCVGYLHSDKLRWSFGVSKGRPAADWYQYVANAPAEQMVPLVIHSGFTAVWVDRYGYPGRRPAVEDGLAALADGPPLVSGDRRYAVYKFIGYKEKFERQITAGVKPVLPVIPLWGGGFFAEDPNDVPVPKRVRWCGPEGTLTLSNAAPYPQRCRITFGAITHKAGDWRLSVDGLDVHTSLPLSTVSTKFEHDFIVPSGAHTIRFGCNATPGVFPTRTIVFRIGDAICTTLPQSGSE